MVARPKDLPEKRVWLSEEDCVRLTRDEFEAVRAMLGAVSYIATAYKDLQKRALMISHGKQRLAMLLGNIRSIVDDIIGTIPQGQCKQLRNVMNDMEMRMVPKMSPLCKNIIIEKSIAKGIIDIAMDRCKGCVEDGTSCKKCELYKLLEGITPLDHWGSEAICPYAVSEWKD